MSNKSIKIAATSDELAAEYRAGATILELARKYGCSFQNISIRLANANVQMRAAAPAKDIPDKICPTCGKTFSTYSRDQRFCCKECTTRIKSVCKRGHVLTEDNRYHFPSSQSRCKECSRIRQRAYNERRKAVHP